MTPTEHLARAICAAETINHATSWEGCSTAMWERYLTFAEELGRQGVGMVGEVGRNGV